MHNLLFILMFLASLFSVNVYASENTVAPRDSFQRVTNTHFFIPNLKRADELGQYLSEDIIKRFKLHPGEKVTIEVIHFGDEVSIPKELSWLINHLKHMENELHYDSVKIKVKLVKPSELERASRFIETQLKVKAKKLINNIEENPNESFDSKKYRLRFLDKKHFDKKTVMRKEAKKFVENLGLYSRKVFGLPRGMNWIMYKHSFTKRTPREHAVEMGLAVMQAAALYGFNYQAVTDKMVESPEMVLYPAAAATTVAGWKVLTGYIERANNAFFVQGMRWQPLHGFSINRAFFLSSAYVHSLVIGMTVQMAAHGGPGNMTEGLLVHTAWNSLLGLFSKALPLYLISKHQHNVGQIMDSESRRHSKWRTIAYNNVFALTFQGLKAVHLFQVDAYYLSSVFVGLGLSGIAYEGFQLFKEGKTKIAKKSRVKNNFQYNYKKLNRFLSFQPPLRTCPAFFL